MFAHFKRQRCFDLHIPTGDFLEIFVLMVFISLLHTHPFQDLHFIQVNHLHE